MWPVWGRKEMHTGFPWGKLKERPFGRHVCRWEDNIKMDLKEIGGEGVDCIHLTTDMDK
jgi:hypothetical protein